MHQNHQSHQNQQICCYPDEYGKSGDPGKYVDSGGSQILVNLVNLVFMLNIVIMVNIVNMVNIVIMVNI